MEVVKQAQGEGWALWNGDSAEILQGLPADSVSLVVTSCPFSSLYTYSASERDLGNSKGDAEFFAHFGYITDELRRVVAPGRNVCVHVQQLTTTKVAHGVIGMQDFRGDVIRHFQQHGWIFHGEVTIDKCPQAQAIRTHSKSLLFVQLRKDSAWMRPALADYILVFRCPGENTVPVQPDLTNDEWIEWARPIWYGIRETETLNAAAGRSEEDERHICPLQLETIERCIRLWSNRGEVVLDPFSGLGSTGYVALQHGRRYLGVELNEKYFEASVKNLCEAERQSRELTLFDMIEREAV
jgi:DNA modification methylase